MPTIIRNARFLVGLLLFALLMATLMAAGLVQSAWAQADGPTAASTVVDVSSTILLLLNLLAPAIATVLGVLATWIATRLASWLGLKIDERHRAAIEQGLDRAVGYASTRLQAGVRGGIPINLRHTAVAEAAQYAQRSIPGALKHFKISSDRLSEMVESRLDGLLVGNEAADGARALVGRAAKPTIV